MLISIFCSWLVWLRRIFLVLGLLGFYSCTGGDSAPPEELEEGVVAFEDEEEYEEEEDEALEEGEDETASSEEEVEVESGTEVVETAEVADLEVQPEVADSSGAEPGAEKKDFFMYTIKKGDWLSKISLKFYGNLEWGGIATANPWIKNPNLIYPGDQIKVPIINEQVREMAESYMRGDFAKLEQKIKKVKKMQKSASAADKTVDVSPPLLLESQTEDGGSSVWAVPGLDLSYDAEPSVESGSSL